MEIEDYSKRSGIDTASIDAILDKLKGTPVGEDYLQSGKGSEARTGGKKRLRNKDGSLRKIDKRTVKRKKSEAWFNLSSEERADRTRSENGSLRGQYHKLKREMKRRDVEWSLTIPEWIDMWSSCPMIDIGWKQMVPAWKHRGKRKDEVQLKRLDKSIGYILSNLIIVHKDRVIWSIDIDYLNRS